MRKQSAEQKLGLKGGLKAVSTIEGKGEPKIGVEEFMAVAGRFGLSKTCLSKIRSALRQENIGEGPFLANYYSGLRETANDRMAKAARKAFDVKYAIPCSSGTGALHSAFVAVGVGPGKEVICPAIGFFATASAVVMAKGIPVFCDVDDSMHMDPSKIEELITPRTVAIAPTAVMGGVYDMGGIMKVARRHKLRVVEDVAQSSGGTFKGRKLGTIGDVGCFSISSYKTVGGGEGGLILTNSKRLYERCSVTVEAGGLWRPERFARPRYKGEIFCGLNYRLSELEAAVDAVQIPKMAGIGRRFRAGKRRILRRLGTYKEIVPQKLNDPDGEVAYQLRFFPKTKALGRKIVKALEAEGVQAALRGNSKNPDWHQYSFMFPITLQATATEDGCPFQCPIYLDAGGKARTARGDCPVADDLFDRVVIISLNQWYSAADCRNIANGINKVLGAYCTESDDATPWL